MSASDRRREPCRHDRHPTSQARLLIAVPAAFAVLLWFHPMIGDYEGLRDVTTRFQVVHVGMVLAIPLLAIGMYELLGGLRGRAATVGRFALIPFVAFYVPYVAFEGISLGVLGQQLNALPAGQRDAIAADLVQDFARNPIFGEPGLFWALGSTAWIVVIVSTVLAFRRAGAPRSLQLLLAASALIGAHAPPLAPIGYACFAAAGWMVLRARRGATAQAAAPATLVMTRLYPGAAKARRQWRASASSRRFSRFPTGCRSRSATCRRSDGAAHPRSLPPDAPARRPVPCR